MDRGGMLLTQGWGLAQDAGLHPRCGLALELPLV